LQSLHEYRDHTRKIHALLVEFLTVEGLIDWWPVFFHAKATGQPYTPVNRQEDTQT
jgi:hypothetical protein